MPTIERSIDVHVPVQIAYDQWRQFAKFPQFMEGVKQVEGFNDNPWQWRAEIAHPDEEWEAKILGRMADQRLGESNGDGGLNEGLVIFQPVSDVMSKVLLQLPYSPEDDVKNAEDWCRRGCRESWSDLRHSSNHVVKNQELQSIPCHIRRFPKA